MNVECYDISFKFRGKVFVLVFTLIFI